MMHFMSHTTTCLQYVIFDCIFIKVLFAIYNEVYRGYGGFGALGHSVYTRELSPKRVQGTWEGQITQIATSGTHTAAITEAGVDPFTNHI